MMCVPYVAVVVDGDWADHRVRVGSTWMTGESHQSVPVADSTVTFVADDGRTGQI